MPKVPSDDNESPIEGQLRELTARTRKLREELRELVRGEASLKDLTKGRAHVPPHRPAGRSKS